MSKILIKSAKILNMDSSHHGKVRDVLVVNGKISEIGKLTSKADKEINAKGMILSSGWCDMRGWLADPGFEHKEDLNTGRKAAMEGGFTHVAVLPNNNPVTQSKNDVAYLKQRNNNELTQLHPIAAVSIDTEGKDLTEMIDLHQAGAVAFSDGLKQIWHSDILLKSIQYVQKFNGLVIDRPEDTNLNAFGVMNEGVISTSLGMKGMPNLGEDIVVQRNLSILEYAGGRLHLSCLSTKDAMAQIKTAKKKGLKVTCDIAAYQPLLEDSLLEGFDSNYKVNPPLRTKTDNKALIKALNEGVIDVIVSNHIPQDEECKKLEFDLADFGIVGFQTVAANLAKLGEEVPLEYLIEMVSTNPKRILGLTNIPIEEGNQADLTLFDPKATWIFDSKTNKSKSSNSPFFGSELKGRAVAAFNNGKSYISKL